MSHASYVYTLQFRHICIPFRTDEKHVCLTSTSSTPKYCQNANGLELCHILLLNNEQLSLMLFERIVYITLYRKAWIPYGIIRLSFCCLWRRAYDERMHMYSFSTTDKTHRPYVRNTSDVFDCNHCFIMGIHQQFNLTQSSAITSLSNGDNVASVCRQKNDWEHLLIWRRVCFRNRFKMD